MQRSLSQSALALRAGVASSTISRWEADTTRPNLPELEAALQVMEIRAEEAHEALRHLKAPRAERRLRQAGVTQTAYGTSSQVLAAAPAGGDLLRAMRVRRGITQTQLASLLGNIPQSFVARWERSQGEAWPDITRLHEICFHLGARAEELSALTLGRFSLANLRDERDPDALHLEQWRLRVEPEYTPDASLKDLRFLALEARLHALLLEPGQGKGTRERVQRLLSWTYSRHAQYLQDAGRVSEAVRPARRAFAVQQTIGPARNEEGWVPALLALAADKVRKEGAQRSGLNLLSRYLNDVESVDYQAWLLVGMARYASGAGLKGEAVDLSRRAVDLVNKGNGDSIIAERRLRLRDHASFLLAAGRAAEAAACLPPGSGEQWSRAMDQNVRDLLLRTEVFAALGQHREAGNAFRRACDLIESLEGLHTGHSQPTRINGLTPLRTQADKLRHRVS